MTLCLSFRNSVRSTFSSSICAFEFRLPSMELYISKRSALFLLRITHRFSLRYRPVLAFLLKTILQFFFKESQILFKSCVPVRIHFAFCSISAYWRKQIFLSALQIPIVNIPLCPKSDSSESPGLEPRENPPSHLPMQSACPPV